MTPAKATAPSRAPSASLPAVFFDHVFKAAGTSLQAILIEHYGGHNLCRVDGQVAALAFMAGRDFPLLAGHVQHTPGFLPFRERICLALVRHPVERAVSAYRHLHRQSLPSADPAVRAAHGVSLEEFVIGESIETAIVRDHQVRHFAAMGAGAADDSPLAAAKAALSLYHAIGVQEEFETLASIACDALGLPQPAQIPFANVGGTAAPDIPRSLRRAIEQVNVDDIALWEWVRQRARRAARGMARPSPPMASHLSGERPAGADAAVRRLRRESTGIVELLRAVVEPTGPSSGHIADAPFTVGSRVRLRVLLQSAAAAPALTVGFAIADAYRQPIFATNTFHLGVPIALQANERAIVDFHLPLNLATGAYVVDVTCHRGSDEHQGLFFHHAEACQFDVANRDFPFFAGIAYLPATVTWGSAGPGELWMSPIDDADPAIRLTCTATALCACPGDSLDVPLRVTNDSGYFLSSSPPAPIALSYHLYDTAGALVIFEGERTLLASPLASGAQRDLLLRVRAPTEPGTYHVMPLVVQEGYRWFDGAVSGERGFVPLQVGIAERDVDDAGAGAAA